MMQRKLVRLAFICVSIRPVERVAAQQHFQATATLSGERKRFGFFLLQQLSSSSNMRRMRGKANALSWLVRGKSAASFPVAAPVSGKAPAIPSSSTPTVRQRALASPRQKALASTLAVIAGGACIAAANLETAPITGRKQLIFDVYKPVTNSSDKGLVPEPPSFSHAILPGAKLVKTGEELMNACSTAIAEAMVDLAASDPALQRHLPFIADKLHLRHYLSLQPDMLSFEAGFSRRVLLRQREGNNVRFHMPAGQLLQCHSISDLLNAMSRELAPYISNHAAEQQSCSLLLGGVGAAALTAALSASSISLVWVTALGVGTYAMAKQVLVDFWLKRQQAYDADAVAAAISTAAGCRPDEVLSAMQRAHVAAAAFAEQSEMQQKVTKAISTELQALQTLLPNMVLPATTIADSKDLQLLKEAAPQQLIWASAQTRAEYKERMQHLQVLIAHKLTAVKSPTKGLFGAEPSWLDRVAHVEKFLADHKTSAPYDITDPDKTPLGKSLGKFKDLHRADKQLQVLSSIRSKSPAELAEQVQADRDRAYDLLTYARALRLQLFTN